METYKIIYRRYYETYDPNEEVKWGHFIARGQWADGHLAYTNLDNPNEEDEGMFVQLRGSDGLYMQRI